MLKNRLFQNLLVFGLFTTLALILILLSNGFRFDVIINGGDTDWFVYPLLEVKDSLTTLKYDGLGTYDYFPLGKLFYAVPALVIWIMTFGNVELTNLIYFSILFALPGFTMFLLGRQLNIRFGLSLLMGLIFMLNPFVYMRFHSPLIHIQWAYMILPFLVYIFINILRNKYFALSVIVYIVGLVSVFTTFNLFVIYLVAIPLLSIYLLWLKKIPFEITKPKVIIVSTMFAIIMVLVASLLSAVLLNYRSEYQNNNLIDQYRSDTKQISSEYKLVETLSGFGTYAWNNSLSEEKPGWQSFALLKPLSKGYLTVIGITLTIILIVLSLAPKRWPFLLAIPVLGFLMNGFGQPFGGIYENVFSNVPGYLDIFRDSWGYWGIVYFFVIALGIGLGLDSLKGVLKKLMTVATVVLWLVIFFIFFIFPGKLINSAWFVEISNEYTSTAKFLTDNYKSRAVLPLPLTSHDFGYTNYSWGYSGPDVLSKMADVGLVDKYLNPISTQEYKEMLATVEVVDIESLSTFLNNTGINVVIVRKDLLEESDINKANRWQELLQNNSCFDLVDANEKLEVYEYICGKFIEAEILLSDRCVYSNFPSQITGTVDISSPFASSYGTCGGNYGLEINGKDLLINSSYLYFISGEIPEGVYEIKNSQDLRVFYGNSLLNNGQKLTVDRSKSFAIDISEFDLIENYDFSAGSWSPAGPTTCDSDQPSEGISLKSNIDKSVTINSPGKQICFSQPLHGKGDNLGSLLITIDTTLDSSIGVCLLDVTKGSCLFEEYFLSDISDEKVIEHTIEKYDNSYYRQTLLIDTKDVNIEDKLALVAYFNRDQQDDYVNTVRQIRAITIPESLGLVRLESDSDIELTGLDGVEITRGLIKTTDISSGNVVIHRDVFSDNWLAVGVSDGKWNVIDSNHGKTLGYANAWYMDDSYDEVYLVFVPQMMYLGGLVISIWGVIIYALVYALVKYKKRER